MSIANYHNAPQSQCTKGGGLSTSLAVFLTREMLHFLHSSERSRKADIVHTNIRNSFFVSPELDYSNPADAAPKNL